MQKQLGFTVIELMIVVVIAVILAMVAAPSMRAMIISNRITSDTNDMVTDLAVARSEAAKRGVRITVCASSNGTSCTGTWTQGRIVFVDNNKDGAVTAGDTVLRVRQALDDNTLTTTNFSTTYIQYRPSGPINSTTAGYFRVCRAGYTGRDINITITGRINTANTASTCP